MATIAGAIEGIVRVAVQVVMLAERRKRRLIIPQHLEGGVVASPTEGAAPVEEEEVDAAAQVIANHHDTKLLPHLLCNFHMSRLPYAISFLIMEIQIATNTLQSMK